MDTSFLGGVLNRPETVPAGAGWGAGASFLRADAPGCRLFTWDSLAVLVRGYARLPGRAGPPDAESVAESLRCCYLERGELAVDGLEGSFTVVLIDGAARRVLLYRNLVGAGFTYYHAGPAGFLFGGNLADLVEASEAPRRPNRAVLPLFFLYRFTPGRDTLFEGFQRLLPGEQLAWDEHGLTPHAAPHLRRPAQRPPAGGHECGGGARAGDDRNDPGGLRHTAAGRGQPALRRRGQLLPSSDLESRRSRRRRSSAQLLRERGPSADLARHRLRRHRGAGVGAGHTLIPADGPYAAYLIETLSATGEPPNHVQTAYFLGLARAMAERGVSAGLCGEGADSLFGVGPANALHEADFARRWIPGEALRAAAGTTCGALGLGRLAGIFRLANRLNDFTDLQHPVNQIASFADWEATRDVFGAAAVAEAAASRRGCWIAWPSPRRPWTACTGPAFSAKPWTAPRSGRPCSITPGRTFFVRSSTHGCCGRRSACRRRCATPSAIPRSCSSGRWSAWPRRNWPGAASSASGSRFSSGWPPADSSGRSSNASGLTTSSAPQRSSAQGPAGLVPLQPALLRHMAQTVYRALAAAADCRNRGAARSAAARVRAATVRERFVPRSLTVAARMDVVATPTLTGGFIHAALPAPRP